MGVHVNVNCNLIKDIVKAVENTNDEAIFVFDNSGLFIRVSDIYKYKVLEIKVSNKDFMEYSCDEPIELGIVINRLKDITKTLRKGDFLILNYEDESDYLEVTANGLKRSIKLINLAHISRIPNLDIHYDYKAVIDHKTFSSFIRASGKAISFDVITKKGNLSMISETDEGLVEVPWKKSLIDTDEYDVNYESKTTFSLNEISKAVSTAKGEIEMRGSENEIVGFSWNISNNSNITAMIAPKV